MFESDLSLTESKVYVPFNTNKLQRVRGTVSVIKEEFFSILYVSLSKYTNSVITVDHHDFGITIWTDGVVRKSNFVSFAGSINDKVVIQVKQETTHVFVVNFPSSVSLVLRNNLSAVLSYEIILFASFFDVDSPTSHIGWGQ